MVGVVFSSLGGYRFQSKIMQYNSNNEPSISTIMFYKLINVVIYKDSAWVHESVFIVSYATFCCVSISSDSFLKEWYATFK